MRCSTTLFILLTPIALLLACSTEHGVPGSAPGGGGGQGGTTTSSPPTGGAGGEGGQDGVAGWAVGAIPQDSCEFTYDEDFVYASFDRHAGVAAQLIAPSVERRPRDAIAHIEPGPPFVYKWPGMVPDVSPGDIVLPGYDDTMPLFARAEEWQEPMRCFETPLGAMLLAEEQAYVLYRAIAEQTTGVPMTTASEVRSVVGLRGAYPGRFDWHGNLPSRFNDTLVLLWRDSDGVAHVRELPANTDTGAHDFGYHSSSSLRANRRYSHENGWHGSYNALHIAEVDYRVRDDSNNNGHWDSDRNGWIAPLGEDDHDRTGSGHNIHMGALDAPLGTAVVGVWSAGCQVIPGVANWLEFILHAWTEIDDPVDYFLVDVRDVPYNVWQPCVADGSHQCPYAIDSLPYSDTRSTASEGADDFDGYNCSAADESGPEIVYLLTVDTEATLSVTVQCPTGVDVDVHLLDGDDASACLVRGDTELSYDITPGRYWIVVDTWAEAGQPQVGEYTLDVSLQ